MLSLLSICHGDFPGFVTNPDPLPPALPLPASSRCPSSPVHPPWGTQGVPGVSPGCPRAVPERESVCLPLKQDRCRSRRSTTSTSPSPPKGATSPCGARCRTAATLRPSGTPRCRGDSSARTTGRCAWPCPPAPLTSATPAWPEIPSRSGTSPSVWTPCAGSRVKKCPRCPVPPGRWGPGTHHGLSPQRRTAGGGGTCGRCCWPWPRAPCSASSGCGGRRGGRKQPGEVGAAGSRLCPRSRDRSANRAGKEGTGFILGCSSACPSLPGPGRLQPPPSPFPASRLPPSTPRLTPTRSSLRSHPRFPLQRGRSAGDAVC